MKHDELVAFNYQLLNEYKQSTLKSLDSAYNAALTVSGGALILSISFVQHFTYSIKTVVFLKWTWVLLTVSLIANILMRNFFAKMSLTEINKNYFKFENPEEPVEEFFKKDNPNKWPIFWYASFHYLFWLSLISGLVMLMIFAWLNV